MNAQHLFGPKKPPFVSYCANLEDVIVNRALPQASGFYVDVGAHEPKSGSVTWALYERGWSGIVIEPMEHLCVRFKELRPRDISLCIALGGQQGEAPFYILDEGGGHSTMVEGIAKQLQKDMNARVSERRVPVRTLADVLDEYAQGRPIDLLKIDSEGAEAEILRGAQLNKYRPKLIVIEAMKPFQQIDASQQSTQILEGHDYVLGYEDGLNKFFVEKESKELLTLLRYPPSVFDNYISYREVALQARVAKLKRRATLWCAAFIVASVALVGAIIAIAI
jgi:FkbM family methyltransferase